MSTGPQPLSDQFPLPEGIKLRTPKFGTNPYAPLIPVPLGAESGDSQARTLFKIGWEDPAQGLTVSVQERDNGHLIADVFSTDPAHLNRGAISVALVGAVENGHTRKTVPFTVPA